MGNPLITESPIRELTRKLEDYEKILESLTDLDNKDKMFKIRETSRRIKDLSDDLHILLSCNDKNDFSLSEEEKSFYTQRFILLNIMSNLT